MRDEDSLKALTKVDRKRKFVKLDIDRSKELQESELNEE